ncbi:MAG: hypothetical protein JXQ73_09490 [Phycisphaerae bacterium]|nr:hypothetical protein [Phycisphaerae bacterium]
MAMQFLIELDGPIVDLQDRIYQAHRIVQAGLGLPSRDSREFWRLYRKGADLAEIVRPTRVGQLQDYASRFAEVVASDALFDLDQPRADVSASLASLSEIAPCSLIAMRPNAHAAQRLLDRNDLGRFFRTLRMLSKDRSVRLSQLVELGGGSNQSVAVVSSESLAILTREADLVVVGVAGGPCTPRRLRQAGAGAVYPDLGGLVEAIRTRDDELMRTGFRSPRR